MVVFQLKPPSQKEKNQFLGTFFSNFLHENVGKAFNLNSTTSTCQAQLKSIFWYPYHFFFYFWFPIDSFFAFSEADKSLEVQRFIVIQTILEQAKNWYT